MIFHPFAPTSMQLLDLEIIILAQQEQTKQFNPLFQEHTDSNATLRSTSVERVLLKWLVVAE